MIFLKKKLRLKRIGRKKSPFYRLVAIDSRKRRDGREIERLGWYNPVTKEFSYKMDEKRILYWLSEGAQPSDTVSGLFRRSGLSYKWDLIQRGISEDEIDSLLDILKVIQTDSIVHNIDSTNYFPKIIHFQKTIIDSVENVFEVSSLLVMGSLRSANPRGVM